jgi:hypothetical protein
MQPRMRFLIDENVADAVRRCINGHGYETLVARDVFETGAPDEMLAFAVEQNGLILVSHDKDFKDLRRTLPQGQRSRIANGAGRILLSMPETRAASRLEEIWVDIEYLWRRSVETNKRLMIKVTLTAITITTNASS